MDKKHNWLPASKSFKVILGVTLLLGISLFVVPAICNEVQSGSVRREMIYVRSIMDRFKYVDEIKIVYDEVFEISQENHPEHFHDIKSLADPFPRGVVGNEMLDLNLTEEIARIYYYIEGNKLFHVNILYVPQGMFIDDFAIRSRFFLFNGKRALPVINNGRFFGEFEQGYFDTSVLWIFTQYAGVAP